jgi:hypothetical protein
MQKLINWTVGIGLVAIALFYVGVEIWVQEIAGPITVIQDDGRMVAEPTILDQMTD